MKAKTHSLLIEKGWLSTSPKTQSHNRITSHTFKETFATNLYRDAYPIIEIMKITGHKTEKAFLKSIKVSKLDAAKTQIKSYAYLYVQVMK